MKKIQVLFFLCLLEMNFIKAQDIYAISGGELLFQSAFIESATDQINTRLRFTSAFHFGEFVHIDLGNNVGLFSGLGLRNVGFITDENDVRIKYRSYNMGVPLAFKVGSFKKNLYVFGGAECEWMFHFKQKTFRDGGKYKFSSWFSRRTPDFIPSAFAGFQFPGGIQVKLKYYPSDFLNHHFNKGDIYNDYTKFKKTQLWYISLSYLMRNKKSRNTKIIPTETAGL